MEKTVKRPKVRTTPKPKADRPIVAIMEDLRRERDAAMASARACKDRAEKAEASKHGLKMTADLAESRAAAVGERDREIQRPRGLLSEAGVKHGRMVAWVSNLRVRLQSLSGLLEDPPPGQGPD